MASGGPCLVFLPAMLCEEDLYRSQIERLRDLVVAGLWLMGCNPGPYRQTVERGLNARVQAGEFDAVVDELAKAVVSRGGPHAIPAMATFRSMARRAGPTLLLRQNTALMGAKRPARRPLAHLLPHVAGMGPRGQLCRRRARPRYGGAYPRSASRCSRRLRSSSDAGAARGSYAGGARVAAGDPSGWLGGEPTYGGWDDRLSHHRSAARRHSRPPAASSRGHVPGDAARRSTEVHRDGALGVQLLADRGGRTDLLHRRERPLQLPDW